MLSYANMPFTQLWCVGVLVGRTVLAPFAQSKLKGNEMYEALNFFFERDRQQFSWQSLKLVLLLRASPMFPFAIINYSCGVSKLAFSTYAAGTAAGMIPWLVIDVYAGRLLTELAEIGKPQSMKYVIAICVFTLVVTVVITVKVRWYLAQFRRIRAKRDKQHSGRLASTGMRKLGSFVDIREDGGLLPQRLP